MTALEKEQYIHDFLCENVRYDKLKKPYSHEIIARWARASACARHSQEREDPL